MNFADSWSVLVRSLGTRPAPTPDEMRYERAKANRCAPSRHCIAAGLAAKQGGAERKTQAVVSCLAEYPDSTQLQICHKTRLSEFTVGDRLKQLLRSGEAIKTRKGNKILWRLK